MFKNGMLFIYVCEIIKKFTNLRNNEQPTHNFLKVTNLTGI